MTDCFIFSKFPAPCRALTSSSFLFFLLFWSLATRSYGEGKWKFRESAWTCALWESGWPVSLGSLWRQCFFLLLTTSYMEGPSLAVMFMGTKWKKIGCLQSIKLHSLPPSLFLVQYYCPQISLVSAHSESLFREKKLQVFGQGGSGASAPQCILGKDGAHNCYSRSSQPLGV